MNSSLLHTAGTQYSTYYKEIDGIRAIAVILVVLFHLEIAGFKGGFVGVDIFFVISGYLITGLLLDELYQSRVKNIDYGLFLIRRAKRIFPALAFTLFLSFFIAEISFRPDDFEHLGGSIFYALVGLSNILFWSQSGYFDKVAYLKPALHTWSLSVELQFYLIWPIIVLFLFRRVPRAHLTQAFFLISAFSVLLNIAYVNNLFEIQNKLGLYLSVSFSNVESSAFFLMPFRIFEFSLGAALLGVEHSQNRSDWVKEAAVFIGFLTIMYAATQHKDEHAYTCTFALLPCFGAALIIYGAKTSRLFGALLRHSLVSGLGLISYSVYLIHWPTIVFYKYIKPESWSLLDKVAVLILSIAIAALLYKFIEAPFRRIDFQSTSSGRRKFWSAVSLSLVIVGAPALHVYSHDGWRWRFPKNVSYLLSGTKDSLSTLKPRAPGCSFTNFKNFDQAECIQPVNGKVNILLMGDSVASYSWMGLNENLPRERFNLLQATPSNCRPGVNWGMDYCLQSNQFMFDFIEKNAIDLTIFASLGPDYNNFRETIRYMKAIGKPVLVVGQPFIFKEKLIDIVAREASEKSTEYEIQSIARDGLLSNTVDLRRAIQKIANEENVDYFDIQEQLCDVVDDLSTCSFIIGNSLITADNNHLTPAASTKIFKKLGGIIRAKYQNLNVF
ncbi:acyltransferase family protein [Methylomonas sp. ZR1]|uniref:acyltransferase family protein n=1 Tax=Methylomonas sp. ZR1 TaxID=1797072 RepID=UPI001492B259|nr:acyltransferase family protein [Methylomonas sp. ZR1]NOV31284.1 acyltransferase [Methylomonas sp. ZR1]